MLLIRLGMTILLSLGEAALLYQVDLLDEEFDDNSKTATANRETANNETVAEPYFAYSPPHSPLQRVPPPPHFMYSDIEDAPLSCSAPPPSPVTSTNLSFQNRESTQESFSPRSSKKSDSEFVEVEPSEVLSETFDVDEKFCAI